MDIEQADPAQVAEDLLDLISEAGWPVTQVNPWGNHNPSPTTTLSDIARAAHAAIPPPPPVPQT